MKTISIDIETYSSVDLKKCGVYKYAESEDFEVLLFAYSVDNSPVIVIDLAQGETIPQEILLALEDENILKWAFYAQFERVCLSRFLGKNLKPHSWRCSLVCAATLGLPLSLEQVGRVLRLEKQKLEEGKKLIKFFCKPCKPTITNEGRTRNLPRHDLDKWNLFKAYNERDVEVEQSLQQKLAKYPVSSRIWEEYELDQEINDRGIGIDMILVEMAIAISGHSRSELAIELRHLTGVENPNSVIQMKEWLVKNGIELKSFDKRLIAEEIQIVPEKFRKIIELRQQLAKNSIKKYTAMENAVCKDMRTRGMFMFYGANRTGRFAGRIVQLQNLPQNHLPDLDVARALVKKGNYDALRLLYDDIPDTLSQLVRTAFIPQHGNKFIVADFSSIEARVLAWLAGEEWRLEAFSQGKDIYCQSASKMFGVPVEKNGVNSHLRQKGKIAELALGYGGKDGALRTMGALQMGLTEAELNPLAEAWRNANPMITNLWWSLDRAVRKTLRTGITTEVQVLKIFSTQNFLFIRLPSGRKLAYLRPTLEINIFGQEIISYDGIGNDRRWTRLETYGPKLVENVVQGIARDLLLNAMLNLKNYSIVAHVHDEVIIEADQDESIENICEIMAQTPEWAPGLLLKAEGYECMSYRKE